MNYANLNVTIRGAAASISVCFSKPAPTYLVSPGLFTC